MLDERYLEFAKELKDLKFRSEELLIKDYKSNFENEKAYSVIKYILEEISEAAYELEHLNRKPLEGILLLNSQGRYNLDTMPEYYFTCGQIIEVFVNNEWQSGRIEHENNSYYFCNYENNNIHLKEGMNARIRVDKK